MRILVLAQRVPFPPHRGDKIATYHYVRHLARRHEVAVACLADGKSDLDNVAGLKPGIAYGESDEVGYAAGKDPVTVHDLHATMLRLLGMGRRADDRMLDTAGVSPRRRHAEPAMAK